MFRNLNPSALGLSGSQSEVIESALTYGFRGMDIDLVEFASRVKLRGIPFARRLLQSAGLRIGSCSLPLALDAEEAAYQAELANLTELAKLAGELGCTRCVCTIAPAGDMRPYHENFELHRRRFQEICRVLEPVGIQLGVGFRAAAEVRKGKAFQFIHDIDALLLLLSMVGAPNLGLVLDSWNLYLSGASMDSLRDVPGSQIVAVQLADLPAEFDPNELGEPSRLLPEVSGGRIDFPGLLVALAEAGYDGPVTILPGSKALEGVRRDQIIKHLGESLDKVWKAAGLNAQGTRSDG